MNTKITVNAGVTMTSREIAELTGKRHDNVMRDIRIMLTELHGDGGVLSFEETYPDPQNGQTYQVFNLPKRETLILVSGYNIAMRAKIIDRWQELETRPTVDPMQVLGDPAAMRGLLLTYTEKVLTLEAKVEEQAPKVAALDRIERGPILWTGKLMLLYQLVRRTHETYPASYFYRRIQT